MKDGRLIRELENALLREHGEALTIDGKLGLSSSQEAAQFRRDIVNTILSAMEAHPGMVRFEQAGIRAIDAEVERDRTNMKNALLWAYRVANDPDTRGGIALAFKDIFHGPIEKEPASDQA